MTTVWTIGHSTREPGEFLALLQAHGIQTLVDVRTVPRSRRVAWSSIDELPRLLRDVGIDYVHMGRALGGSAARGSATGASSLTIARTRAAI